MSSSNLEVNAVNAVNRANEASETSRANAVSEMSEVSDLTAELSAKHVTKFRLDEINKMKDYLNAEIKERKDIVKKLVNTLLLLIMQTNLLLHYLHRLAL